MCRHVVLCGAFTYQSLSDFLTEFFHEDHGMTTHDILRHKMMHTRLRERHGSGSKSYKVTLNPSPWVCDILSPGEVSSLYHVLVLDPHEPSNRLESLFSHAAYVHRVGYLDPYIQQCGSCTITQLT
jgi:hypothetical protein